MQTTKSCKYILATKWNKCEIALGIGRRQPLFLFFYLDKALLKFVGCPWIKSPKDFFSTNLELSLSYTTRLYKSQNFGGKKCILPIESHEFGKESEISTILPELIEHTKKSKTKN